MLGRILIPLCLAILLAFAYWATRSADDDRVDELDVEVEVMADDVESSTPLALPNTSVPHREVASPEASVDMPPVETQASEADEAAVSFPLSGHVYDLKGLPVAGVQVRQVGQALSVESDGNGRFQLDIDPEGRRQVLRAKDPRWVTVYECEIAREGRDHFIVVAPAIELAGHVLDEAGQGVVFATVELEHLQLLRDDFPYPLDGNRLVGFRTSAEEDGSFAFRKAPSVPEVYACAISAVQTDYGKNTIDLPGVTTLDLTIVLGPQVIEGPQVGGRVLLPSGEPAAGARVRLGENSVKAGTDGRFALPLEENVDDDLQLAAGLDEYAPAIIEGYGALVNAAWPQSLSDVVLQLGPALEISGVVLGEDGEPAAGWQVSLQSGTELSRWRFPPILAEELGPGGLRGQTKDDGAFRLTGLLPRDYTLLVRDQKTLQTFYSHPIAAGDTEVTLRVPSNGLHESVQGVVVDLTGLPIESASVSVGLVLHRSDFGLSSTALTAVTTDAEGKFELHDVPTEHVHFNVGGDAVTPQMFEWEGDLDPRALVFAVARRCHFRLKVVGADPDASLSYELVDAEGDSLYITTYHAGGSGSTMSQTLEPGENPVRAVSQSATVLRVRDGQSLVHEQPIWLDPTDVTEIVVELP